MVLTDIAIRNAKPAEKPLRLYDRDGLYLEISPAGGKWWRLKYHFAGKEKRISLGVHPEVDLKKARQRTLEARQLIAERVDPSEHKKAAQRAAKQQDAYRFEAVAREWITRMAPGWAPRHAARVLARFERDVFPWLGPQPIARIGAPDVLSVLRRIETRGAIESAHRALTSCSQVFRYAVAMGRADRDPTRDLRGALPPVKVTHFAAITEPQRVGLLLRALDNYQGTPVVRGALRLAPMVFVRPGELRAAQWGNIDLATEEWRFTVSKTQTEHIVPLARQAVAILRDLQPLTGRSRYVFPSARGHQRPMSDNAILAAMRTLHIGKEDMSGHGFRALARTILDEVLHYRPDLT